MVAGKFGQPTVAEIVFRGGALAVIRLERADEIFRIICPEASLLAVFFEILLNRLIAFPRHCEVPGKNVIKRRNISRALDGSVTA